MSHTKGAMNERSVPPNRRYRTAAAAAAAIGSAAVVIALACGGCSSPKPEAAGAPPGAGAGSGPAKATGAADAGVPSFADGSSEASADADSAFPWDANACTPTLPPGFQPASVTALVNKVCTSTQIAQFVQVCLGTDMSSCAAWTQDPANDKCFHDCIVSPYSATPTTPGMTPAPPMAAWGPIIDTENPGATTWFNVSGCIALADPTKSKCALDLSQRFQCEYAACASSCPVPPDDPEGQWVFDYQNCTTNADYSACQTYTASVSNDCTMSTPDGGPAAFCYAVASGDAGALTELITQQCGM
jgi:hypothetical protein